MRLFADEDVYSILIGLLRERGHDVTSPIRIALRGIGDELCLLHAATDDRTILTHNGNDFELLHRAWLTWSGHWDVPAPLPHAGILIVPQLQLLQPEVTAKCVDELLQDRSSLSNAFFRLDPSGRWKSYR